MVLVLEGSSGGECTSINHALEAVAVDADEVPPATQDGRTLMRLRLWESFEYGYNCLNFWFEEMLKSFNLLCNEHLYL